MLWVISLALARVEKMASRRVSKSEPIILACGFTSGDRQVHSCCSCGQCWVSSMQESGSAYKG